MKPKSKRKSAPGAAIRPKRPPLTSAALTGAPWSVPIRWTWHCRALQTLRERLQTDRGILQTAASEPIEPHSMSLADSASDELDHNLTLTELTAEQDILVEVEAALSRIRNGTYGKCQATGKPIPPARLRAIPWARFSREVAEALEKRGAVPRAHLGAVRSLQEEGIAQLQERDEEDEEPIVQAADETVVEIPVPEEPREATSSRKPSEPRRKPNRPGGRRT